ncbi:Cation-chloride cotransporter 1 [Abeliophyllum distichum]|uniref:Cation-chloride cotransporter 1 n=1 Tax=Abeliophyllum distichum TaxID=126358 RepID=A0ABD1UJU2_9LAMI
MVVLCFFSPNSSLQRSFESCKIQVFCIAVEDSNAEELKADVRKFLYDLRMQAEVIVISMKSWDAKAEQQDESVDAFAGAHQTISSYLAGMKERAQKEKTPLMADGKHVVLNEQG